MAKRKVKINGKDYVVIESLGYRNGKLSIVVADDSIEEGERIAVKEYGTWRFWDITDRLITVGGINGLKFMLEKYK